MELEVHLKEKFLKEDVFLHKLVSYVVNNMKEAYPELEEKKK